MDFGGFLIATCFPALHKNTILQPIMAYTTARFHILFKDLLSNNYAVYCRLAVALFTFGTYTTNKLYSTVFIIIIISGFGIYGAAVVPDSGVGNTWQRLTLIRHEFLSNG